MSRVLYCANRKEFIKDVIRHRFMPKMISGAQLYHLGFSPSEERSWNANALEIKNLLDLSGLPDDVYVSFEYRVPHGPMRIDCMLYGCDSNGNRNVIHLELKQWGNDSVNELYDTGVFNASEVEAFTGGYYRTVAHPSQQVQKYQEHLENYVSVFEECCRLQGLAYCYNYDSEGQPCALYAEHYRAVLDRFPLFSGNQVESLAMLLQKLLCVGKGLDIFNKVQDSPIRPSKNLLDAAANMFRGVTEFALLDDQLTASETIFGEIKKNRSPKDKTVIIVKGGPGTGKTVIALNILAQLAQEGKYTNSFFTTRSNNLRDNLRLKLNEVKVNNRMATSASDLIRDIFDFKPHNFSEGEIDVLLVDEAHRIGKSSNFQTDRMEESTQLSQTISLMYCSKVCVFFIDDKQAIKATEIGTAANLREAAEHYAERLTEDDTISSFKNNIEHNRKSLVKAKEQREKLIAARSMYDPEEFERRLSDIERKIKSHQDQIGKERNLSDVKSSFNGKVHIIEYELKSQFRCNGSDNYLDWLDETLYRSYDRVRTTFSRSEYDFRIYESPVAMYEEIRRMEQPDSAPKQTARIAAGYCWEWKGNRLPNGDLAKEVVIKDQFGEVIFEMPWETQKGKRATGAFRAQYASSAETWATENAGINQVGCVFSIQGLELDYIGVIIGEDLDYDEGDDCLRVVPGKTHSAPSGAAADRYVRNIYRVLLSRGKKGCFVYSCNPKVSDYLKRCAEKGPDVMNKL